MKRTGPAPPDGAFSRVHAIVGRIPRGRVATYGQISRLVDGRLTPVGVGWALRAGEDLPWHRVVAAEGRIRTDGESPGLQRSMLEAEGVRFLEDGRVDLGRHAWRPRGRRVPCPHGSPR